MLIDHFTRPEIRFQHIPFLKGLMDSPATEERKAEVYRASENNLEKLSARTQARPRVKKFCAAGRLEPHPKFFPPTITFSASPARKLGRIARMQYAAVLQTLPRANPGLM